MNDSIWIVLMMAMLGFMFYYRIKQDMYGLVCQGFIFIGCILLQMR